MDETITTVRLLLNPAEPINNSETTISIPDTGEFSRAMSDSVPGSEIGLFLFIFCAIMIIIQLIALFYEKKTKEFSISSNKMAKKIIVVCFVAIACCAFGGFSVNWFKRVASATNGEQAIALTSSENITINTKVGDFSYTCDSLNIATKTPAGYKIYARTSSGRPFSPSNNQGGDFSWTDNGELTDNTVGYTLKNNNISADDNEWGGLSESWKVIKTYDGATDMDDSETRVCYGIKSGSNNNTGEYSMKVYYYAAAQSVDYILEYDANGGPSAPAQQKYENTIETSHTFAVVNDIPVRENHIFLGWSTTPDGNVQYRRGDDLITDKTFNRLYAVWVEDSPIIEYSFPNDGKYIFINNEELLDDYKYFADDDKGNSLLYASIKVKDEDMSIENDDDRRKDAYPGAIEAGVPTEIYYEHYIPWQMRTPNTYDSEENRFVNDNDNKMHYAIRLYNPSDSEATVLFGRCGSTVLHNNQVAEMEQTFKQYYSGGCKLNGAEVVIGPGQSGIIMPTWNDNNETDSWGRKWNLEFFLNPDPEAINMQTSIDSIFDGVVSLESDKFLFISAFIFADYSKTFDAVYGGNFSDGPSQYSGYFDKAPITKQSSTYYITDDTSSGTLKTRYRGVDGTIYSNDDNTWRTNDKGLRTGALLSGDYAMLNVPIDSGDGQLRYMTMGPYYNGFTDERYNVDGVGTVFNWGNWGVHYEDEITIKNLSTTQKTVTFNISVALGTHVAVYYDGNARALNYDNSGNYIDNEIWEIEIPAGEERTVTASSTLCGESYALVRRRVVLK